MHQIERGLFVLRRGRQSDRLTRRYVHAKVHSAGHWLHDTRQGALPRG